QYYQSYKTHRCISICFVNVDKCAIANFVRHVREETDRSGYDQQEPEPESPISGYIAVSGWWPSAYVGPALDRHGGSLRLWRCGLIADTVRPRVRPPIVGAAALWPASTSLWPRWRDPHLIEGPVQHI